MLLEAKAIGQRKGWMLHVHVDQMLMRYSKRTLPLLDEAGYLDEQFLAVYLTEATDEEVALVARCAAADPVHKEMALLEAMEKEWL